MTPQPNEPILPDNIPKLLGRFNFLSYKKDSYNLLFTPYEGAACMLIARNLPREIMENLKDDLNRATRNAHFDIRDFIEHPDEFEHDIVSDTDEYRENYP